MPITITSIAGGAPKPVFDRLGPLFEESTGNRLNALYDTMSGIAARVTAGEALDVLVMPVPLIESYVQDGTVLAEGRAKLANIGLAIGVKAGSKMPDVSTRDALRAALLAARSVVHAPPSATPSGAQSEKIVKELGLSDTLVGRVVHKAGLAGGLAMIASGEAELGIFPKSEIVNAPGVVSAGSPPKDLDLHAVYAAGVKATSKAPDAAAAFIAFLTEAESCKVWLACGFDPL
jgi:molybdate transport system substrate-binding protein